ncbi:MAG: PQQ-like beta-propeller repeat protein [Chloroflexi bacterium]|nr:PQQ-like beta-propeller repeat protein [Chloroflexota bacterium]
MKNKRLLLFLVLGLLALTLSACGGAPPTATWPGLAADGENAYLANGTNLYAIRLTDGEQVWAFASDEKSTFYANPAFTSDGQLLVGSTGNDRTLYRIDPKLNLDVEDPQPTVTWKFNGAEDHWVATPLVVGEIVYAPNADGNLYIFDLSITGENKLVDTVDLGSKLWAKPATDGERVFVGSLDHHLHIIDMQTLAVDTVALGGAVNGTPAVLDGKLYIGSFDSAMVAINIEDGNVDWTSPTASWIWSGPLLFNNILYFGDLEGNFYSLKAADGQPALDSVQPDGAILASPILVDGKIVFVTENGTVYMLEEGSNSPVSLEKLEAKIYTDPVLAGDLILVAPFQDETSLLVALNKDGSQKWSFTPKK